MSRTSTVATARSSAASRPLSAPSRGRGSRWQSLLARGTTYALLIIALAMTLLPFVWMALGSVKTQNELLQRPLTWWPKNPTWANFNAWFTDFGFGRYFTNSLVVAVITVVGNLVFCSMVGYALAKIDFPGRRALFVTVMVMLMVPGTVTMIPMFVLIANMGLVNTYPALILPFLASPLGVFIMRQFMQAIPNELLEAARVDGAGELRIFFRVVLPLCGPALATVAIFTFLASWNNFLWPLVVAQTGDMYTLPVALSLFSTGAHGTDYGLMMAGAVLVVTPILIVFIFLQKYFIQGVATTGIK